MKTRLLHRPSRGRRYAFLPLSAAVIALAACGSSGGDSAEDHRPHDERTFVVNEAGLPFDALASYPDTHRWWGELGGAGYRVEVPKNWNGMLVMYAHGYAGTGPALNVSNPRIREHLVAQGYAWAASSYSANYYDVRAGVEDTNRLALEFRRIAVDNGVELEEPARIYIVGHSMGGHITAAAVERETMETANYKVRYDGAVPMCGVLGDLQLYNYFGAAQLAAQKIAGQEASAWPVLDWADIDTSVRDALFVNFPSQTTALGEQYKAVVMYLTGGPRPMFDEGFAGPMTATVWGTFGRKGTIVGILNEQAYDTRDVVYQLDADPALSAGEIAFNESILRISPEPDANRLRRDGLRWFPAVNGEVDVPVVTAHTLGDMYVPFSMEQIYRRRAEEKGSGQWIVQRAIRGVSHCDFLPDEEIATFEAMVRWEQHGERPQGDDVLDHAIVAAPDYGCKFSSSSRPGCPVPPQQ